MIAPATDNDTDTKFGVGGCPATVFKFDAVGNTTSAGKNVTNDEAVGLTAVAFKTTAVASTGITQFPLVPWTCTVNSSFAPTGDDRGPTLSEPALVSNNRHGEIGTNTDAVPVPAASTNPTPLATAADNIAATPT